MGIVIANPLFDAAFKKFAGDHEIASAIIETLLDVEVVETDDLSSYESKIYREMDAADRRLMFLRVDHIVRIRDKDGATQKVLVKMRKGSWGEEIMRFREYAVAGYLPKIGETNSIPIVTIYFLGFEMNQVDTPCLKITGKYTNMLNNGVLDTKENFVKLFTHDSYIIQIPRINIDREPQTRLEKILSIFEQKNFIDYQDGLLNYKYPINDSAVKKMVDVLHYFGTDPDERKTLENEAYWRSYDYHTAGALLRQLDELAEKDPEYAEYRFNQYRQNIKDLFR
jgi:hypothetical protein